MVKIKYVLIAAALALTVFSCKTMFETIAGDTGRSPNIRVNLLLDGDVYKIKLNRYIRVENDSNGDRLNFDKHAGEIVLKKENNTVFLNNARLEYPLKIYSIDNRLISVNDKKYFGIIKVIPESGDIRLINFVPTETYLMSVLLSEMPLSFNLEALKAQVVVARTYAVMFMNRYAEKRDFDVDNTTNYQVYKGYNFPLDYCYIKKIERAVKETEGEIVTYDDKPILAYFHANSGGKLTSGKDYFGENSDFPYLVNKDDPYSLNYPGSTWEYKTSLDDFLKLFGCRYRGEDNTDDADDLIDPLFFDDTTGGLRVILDRLYGMEFDRDYAAFSKDNLEYSDNGFIKSIRIKDKIYGTKEIRKTAGYSVLKSIKFKINIDGRDGTIVFNGVGYGHGVGMSQWGAEGMAEKGFKFDEIINFYYPNTKIEKIENENINF